MAPLVFLPGALGTLDGGGQALELLTAGREVIPIAYRVDEAFDTLCDRIAAAGGSGQFDLLGQSAGGWIGQCVAARAPRWVRRLVLSHSFVLHARDAWRLRLARRTLAGLPRGLVGRLLRARIATALHPVAAREPVLHRRMLAEVATLARSEPFLVGLISQQDRLIASLTEPPAAATCPVLIVESDNDPLVPSHARRTLKARYPDATVECFGGAGHVSALVSPKDYAASVSKFLDAPSVR